MAAEEDDVITFIFTGEEGEVIPEDATRFIAHESVTVIPARLFYQHPNIVELICHVGVIRIEAAAFYECPNLRRVIIPGVKAVEDSAFYRCKAVAYIECPKLERIGREAFHGCESLGGLNMSSAKVVNTAAFIHCPAMTDVEFGENLESIRNLAFHNCRTLERITIPLKNGLFTAGDNHIFTGCYKLKTVDLVERAVLRDTIAALLLDEWRNDMNEEIVSINQILPNARAGFMTDKGGKLPAIRQWVTSALRKIIHYKSQHCHLLNVAATSLMHTLPTDIVMNSILPFLELPAHTFDGEEEFEEDSSTSNSGYSDESYDTSDGGDDDDDEDGAKDEDNKDEESHDSSFNGGGHLEEEGDDDKGRKKRKL